MVRRTITAVAYPVINVIYSSHWATLPSKKPLRSPCVAHRKTNNTLVFAEATCKLLQSFIFLIRACASRALSMSNLLRSYTQSPWLLADSHSLHRTDRCGDNSQSRGFLLGILRLFRECCWYLARRFSCGSIVSHRAASSAEVPWIWQYYDEISLWVNASLRIVAAKEIEEKKKIRKRIFVVFGFVTP